MKRIIYFTLFIILSSSVGLSQNDDKGKIKEAAIDLVFGAAEAAIQLQLYIEDLELQATNYILATRPDLTSFRVKLMGIDNTSLLDFSNVEVFCFALVSYDKNSLEEIDRNVFMLTTSKGWINENGIEFEKTTWKTYDNLFFNELYREFVDLVTPFEIQGENIPLIKRVEESEFDFNDPNYFITYNKRGGIKEFNYADYSQLYPISMLLTERTKFKLLDKYISYNDNSIITEIHMIKRGGDDYLVRDFDDEIKIVYNEKRFGLYNKKTQELTKLDLYVLNKANMFLNKFSDEAVFGKSIEETAEKQSSEAREIQLRQDYEENLNAFNALYTQELSFEIGKKGLIILNKSKSWEDYILQNVDEDDIVEFELIKIKDEKSSKPVYRIRFERDGLTEEKWVRANNDDDEIRFEI